MSPLDLSFNLNRALPSSIIVFPLMDLEKGLLISASPGVSALWSNIQIQYLNHSLEEINPQTGIVPYLLKE